MDVYEAIEKRRTVRSFSHGASEQQLRKLLFAGVRAPSGSNVQPWEFIIVDDPAVTQQIAEHKYQQTLKMALDNMFLDDPATIEKVFNQTGQIPSPRGARIQREAYRNCTVVAVCNQKGHGKGRKPWMNVENIASTWMCIENMTLVATAEGLGIQISILREEHKIAVEILPGVTDDYELATMLLIGRPAEVPREKEMGTIRPDFGWLHRNKFRIAATLA